MVIFHLVQLALLHLFCCSLIAASFAISLLTVLALSSFSLLHFFLSFYCFLFLAISFFLVLAPLAFSLLHFLLFLNCFFFLALSCCSCASPSFVTVPVSALATEEYPTVKSAIAQIGNSFFSFHFSPFIRFTSLRIGCITRINKRYKYKMQMKYISFKDFIVENKNIAIYTMFFGCVSQLFTCYFRVI